LKRYELESLLKSFILFFGILSLLLFLLYWQDLKLQFTNLDKDIENRMKVCSIELTCKEFDMDFAKKDVNRSVNKLYKTEDKIYSYFLVPEAPEYLLELSYPINKYKILKDDIEDKLIKKYIIYAFLLSILSIVFSLYSLYPLKKALKINDEFVKDMLHDINTPLSAMNINLKYLEKTIGSLPVIDRLKSNYSSIIALQDNLKNSLSNSKLQKQEVNLFLLADKSLKNFKSMYKDVKFINNTKDLVILANEDAFKRVIDNLIQNACKHNINKGLIVEVGIDEKNIFYIKDNGNGIENIDKIFARGYTKGKRGLGLGLNIVKKLLDELDIDISIKSKLKLGTTFYLNLNKVIN